MELKNKRVLVVGLGKSGISAALFLRGQGARVTVSDTRSAVALAAEIPALLEAGIMGESGGHGLLTFRRGGFVAVVLNITPDHLDRHGSFENYATAKARITERQGAEDFLVLNAEDKATQMVAGKTKAQVFWFSGRRPIKQGAFVHGESILFVPKE